VIIIKGILGSIQRDSGILTLFLFI